MIPAGLTGAIAASIDRIDQALAGPVVAGRVREMGFGLRNAIAGNEVSERHRAAGERVRTVAADQGARWAWVPSQISLYL